MRFLLWFTRRLEARWRAPAIIALALVLALPSLFALSDMRATVVALTDDGRPGTVEFRFATPLESAGRRWMRGAGMGLVPWTPPPVGATVVVPAPL